jgi:hypothetical protein
LRQVKRAIVDLLVMDEAVEDVEPAERISVQPIRDRIPSPVPLDSPGMWAHGDHWFRNSMLGRSSGDVAADS